MKQMKQTEKDILTPGSGPSYMRWAGKQCIFMVKWCVYVGLSSISLVTMYAFLKNKGMTEIASVISAMFTGFSTIIAALLIPSFAGKATQSFAELKYKKDDPAAPAESKDSTNGTN